MSRYHILETHLFDAMQVASKLTHLLAADRIFGWLDLFGAGDSVQ